MDPDCLIGYIHNTASAHAYYACKYTATKFFTLCISLRQFGAFERKSSRGFQGITPPLFIGLFRLG